MSLSEKEKRDIRRKAVQIRGTVHMLMTSVNEGQFDDAKYHAVMLRKLAIDIHDAFEPSDSDV